MRKLVFILVCSGAFPDLQEMCDSITSSIRLAEALRESMCGGESRVKTARVCAGVKAGGVCEVSHGSILAFSPRLVLSKGIGCLFGRWIQSLTMGARPDLTYSSAMAHLRTWWSSAWQKVQVSGRGPKREKEAAALVLTEGAGVVDADAVLCALHGCSGKGGGAVDWYE